jgi:hypothetical protein
MGNTRVQLFPIAGCMGSLTGAPVQWLHGCMLIVGCILIARVHASITRVRGVNGGCMGESLAY